MPNQAAEFDQVITLNKNTYYKTHNTFLGWNTNPDGSGTYYADQQSVSNIVLANSNTITLYAIWNVDTYTVIFDGNGATSGERMYQTIAYDQLTPLANTPFSKKGYTFVGWNTKADGSGTDFANQSNVTNLA